MFAGLPQGIQLAPPSAHAGRLLVCANHLTAQGGHSHVIYSDDGGGTWANGASVRPSHTGECSLAQTGGSAGGAGSAVLLYARVWWDSTPGSADKSTRALASSADGGATFSTANVSAFPGNPGTDTQGAMVSTGPKDGRLLVSSPWGEKHFPRMNFTVLISSGDEPSAAGFRWVPMPSAAPLYAGASEYSSLLSTPELQRSRTFFVCYERGGSGSAALRLTQLRLPPKGYALKTDDNTPPVDPSEPPKLMRAFFAALAHHNIDHLHDNLTSRDFHIYEGNISFTKKGWFDYVRSKGNSTNGEWTLTDFVVSVDDHSAQVYYDDRAVFTNSSSGAKTRRHWIESAYMVREDEALKVKFISSTSVNL